VLGLQRKHPFVYPIRLDRPPPRLAVFLPCFLSRPPVRVFRKAWAAEKWSEEGWPDHGWSEERRAENGCGDRGVSEWELSETRGNQDRCSEERWSKELQKFAPEAIAATLEQFKRLVHAEIPRLRNAVIVLHRTMPPGGDAQLCNDALLTDPARSYDAARKNPARSCHAARLSDGERFKRDVRLTDADRDWLWSAFRVPVFEQIIGESGELLATECEAHNGMHVQSPNLRSDPGDLDLTPCACGRDSPRLFTVREAGPPEIPQRSATAHA